MTEANPSDLLQVFVQFAIALFHNSNIVLGLARPLLRKCGILDTAEREIRLSSAGATAISYALAMAGWHIAMNLEQRNPKPKDKPKMKISNYRKYNPVILMITCISFLCGLAAGPAMSADAPSAHAQPVQGAGTLIIRRIPNLGNNVTVVVYVDRVSVGLIPYGRSYEGPLPAGHRVLSVVAQGGRRRTPVETTLDVQSGQTYNFTALSDGSGSLILKGR